MKSFSSNFNLITVIKVLKTNTVLTFFSLFLTSIQIHGQTVADNPQNCQNGVSIQVFYNSATTIRLGHAARFLFLPNANQVTTYTLSVLGSSTPFAQETFFAASSGTNNNSSISFELPNWVTTADSIAVNMVVTNTNGDTCTANDILHWTDIGSPLGAISHWRSIFYPTVIRGSYSNVLSTSTFDNNLFSFYPNPVKDKVNFTSKETIENLSICNLLGQEVLLKTINSSEFVLDVSSLSNGTYFAKLSSNKTFKIVKFVKN